MTSSDDLLRSHAERLAATDGAFPALGNRDEGELYAMLAAMSAGTRDTDGNLRGVLPSSDDLVRSGAAVALGKKIFTRWSKAFHDFLCAPSQDDKDLRDRVLQAIFDKKTGGTAIVAGALVAAFALSPITAGLIAALIMRLIVAPAADGICEAWTDSLQTSAAAKPAQ